MHPSVWTTALKVIAEVKYERHPINSDDGYIKQNLHITQRRVLVIFACSCICMDLHHLGNINYMATVAWRLKTRRLKMIDAISFFHGPIL